MSSGKRGHDGIVLKRKIKLVTLAKKQSQGSYPQFQIAPVTKNAKIRLKYHAIMNPVYSLNSINMFDLIQTSFTYFIDLGAGRRSAATHEKNNFFKMSSATKPL